MKQNRKRSKRMSVVASHTMHVFGVMIVLFAMVIVNMLASSSCTQLSKKIGEKRNVLKSLENDCRRETARWDGMKTIDQLEQTMAKLGLNMKYERAVQIIKMDANGRPLVAQNSVKEALRRQGVTQTASFKATVPAPATAAVRASVPAARVSAPARTRSARRVRR